MLFAYYFYRVTVPPVSSRLKFLLSLLRALALFMIVALIFEPVIKLTFTEKVSPKVVIAIDNSQSVKKYSDKIKNTTRVLLDKLDEKGVNSTVFTFGKKVDKIEKRSVDSLNFDESLTNMENLFDSLKNTVKADAAIIITDGGINSGITPLHKASRTPFPVYFLGVGDTSEIRDVSIARVLHNSYAYLNKKTEIELTLKNKGFAGVTLPVTLKNNGQIVSVENVTLSPGGVNTLTLEFAPQKLGENKITLEIPNVKGDLRKGNNRKVFYLNVLKSKIKVALVCGAPDADFAFIKNLLSVNEEFEVSDIIEISTRKNIPSGSFRKILEKADVLFLISFPALNSSSQIIAEVLSAIQKDSKPFAFVAGIGTDFNKLKEFESELNFSFAGTEILPVMSRLYIIRKNSPLLKLTQGDEGNNWNNLPPFVYWGENVSLKSGAVSIANALLKNRQTDLPVIVKYSVGRKRSVSILAGNIWRWKLRANKDADLLLDDFLQNIVKWLNAANDLKRIKIAPLKKVFAAGETVNFEAEILDESLNPVDDADVEITVNKGQDSFKAIMTNKYNGLYECSFENLLPGDYSYVGKAFRNHKFLGQKRGKFSIEDVNLEILNSRLQKELLRIIAKNSGGKYFDLSSVENFMRFVEKQLFSRRKTKVEVKEYKLWSYEITLFLIVLIFSLEWFLRKRNGLL